MKNKDTLVVVPAFNEFQNLEGTVLDLNNYFKNILVVNDGSNDSSEYLLEQLNIRHIKHSINLGQGAALHTGFTYFLSKKKFKYVITFDGDGQNRASDAKKMLNVLKKKNFLQY